MSPAKPGPQRVLGNGTTAFELEQPPALVPSLFNERPGQSNGSPRNRAWGICLAVWSPAGCRCQSKQSSHDCEVTPFLFDALLCEFSQNLLGSPY
jgi:hypothetical protein